MDNTILLNVSLLPSPAVADQAIRYSNHLHGAGLFALDPEKHVPHLTLYMARFPRTDLDDVRELLEQTFADVKPVEVVSEGWFRTPGNYLEISYRRTDELRGLQERVIERLAPLRFIPSSYDTYKEDYFGPYSIDQQRNVVESGYDLVGDSFRPHITVTRFRDNAVLVGRIMPNADEDLTFCAETAALAEADNYGAARRIVRSYGLGGGA